MDVRQPLREFVQELADEECDYGDDCPPQARHYRCLRCKALAALSASAEAPGREHACHPMGKGWYVEVGRFGDSIVRLEEKVYSGKDPLDESDLSLIRGCSEHLWAFAGNPDAAPKSPSGAGPVAMLLYCPRCQKQHIDAPETDEQYAARLHESAWWEGGGHKPPRWTNPPHATHTCKDCGLNWRPSNVPTVGVAAIPVAELGSEAKHIERMDATNPALYVAPSSSAAEIRERAAKVCNDMVQDLIECHMSLDRETGAAVWDDDSYEAQAMALTEAAAAIRQLQEG